MKKKLFFVIILAALLLALVLSGFTRLKTETQNGLNILKPTIVLGGEPPVQKITYRLTLHNGNRADIQVDWIKPVVDTAFKAMMGDQKLTLNIAKVIPAGESIQISGQFQVKTNGIPKEELDKMGVLVKSFQVSSRQTFPAPEISTEAVKKTQPETEATSTPEAAPKSKKAPKATATPEP